MAVFEPLVALAVNTMVLPNCMDVLMLGFRVIFAGNGEAPAGLWPPQAGNSKSINMVAAIAAACNEQNLPMHPLVARGRIRRAKPTM
jgi:hypothetical protein